MHISRAVDEIRHGMEKLSINLSDGTDMFDGCAQQQVFHSAWVASQRYKQDRDDGLKYIHTRTNIDGIIYNDMDTYKFKQQYINRNIPCIIQGMDNNYPLIFEVYNRWGNQVYKNPNYQNDWGHQELSTGVYYFSTKVKEFDCTQIKGFVLIEK